MDVLEKPKFWLKHSRVPLLKQMYSFLSERKRNHSKQRRMAKVARGKGRLITLEDLTSWTKEWIKSFPESYDLIVGIPRSGLFVASLISIKLGRPLATPDVFVRGEHWKSKSMPEFNNIRKILLVEDCLNTGKDMDRCHEMIKQYSDSYIVTRAAPIVHEKSKNKVDLYYKVVPHPRFFEWEFIHHKKVQILGVDMDGVLCENCPSHVDKDDALYMNWLSNARPYLIPYYEIDFIITNRLEKYRAITEKWLADHNVRYNKLIMWNVQDKSERSGGWVANKVKALQVCKPNMFIESNVNQAQGIWEATSIPTLCTDEMILFQ